MKDFFRDILIDKTTRLVFLLSLISMMLALLLTVSIYRNLPPFVPVFNQLSWGQERLGERGAIFIPISITFFIFIGNLVFSSSIYKKVPLASRMLSVACLLVCLLALLFVIKTILLIL